MNKVKFYWRVCVRHRPEISYRSGDAATAAMKENVGKEKWEDNVLCSVKILYIYSTSLLCCKIICIVCLLNYDNLQKIRGPYIPLSYIMIFQVAVSWSDRKIVV